MTRAVSIDGRSVAPEDAKVSVYDRGFVLGDGVFETLRTYDGEPFALGDHLARLGASARTLGIAMPIAEEELAAEVRAAIAAAGGGDRTVRVMLTRGAGDLALVPNTPLAPTRVVLVDALRAPPPEAYARGISLSITSAPRPHDDTPASTAKVLRYVANMLAVADARRRGADEALFVAPDGAILEGATSNFFLVLEGTLVTCPVSLGVLPGIVRARVLELARRLGVPVEERALRREELGHASEAFATSSLREVMPVTRIDGAPIGDGAPGPRTRQIHAEFRRALPGRQVSYL